MVVAENEEVVVAIRDQGAECSATAVIHILFAGTVFSGVVVVSIAPGGSHLHVAGLGHLILQARAVEAGIIEQNVQRCGGVRIARGEAHHE